MKRFVTLMALTCAWGMLVCSSAAATPVGWEEGKEGLIYLRVQLSEAAGSPIYLEGQAGWRYPRRSYGFTLGHDGLPVFQADEDNGRALRPPQPHQWGVLPRQPRLKAQQTELYIQPGGYSQWVELPPAVLGPRWENQVVIAYPRDVILRDTNLAFLPDASILVEVASAPCGDAVVKQFRAMIGPNHPTVGMVIHRMLEQPVARDTVSLSEETQRDVGRLLEQAPAYGRRPMKFPISISLSQPQERLPSLWQGMFPHDAWEIELKTLEMLGVNGIHWQMGAALREHGFVNNAVQAFYWPYFPTEQAVGKFVQGVAARIDEADAWDDVVTMSMFEENAGPSVKALLEGDKQNTAQAYRLAFIDYLKQRHLTPAKLGKRGWDEVRLVSPAEAGDEPELFYHTARFRPWVITNTLNMVDRIGREHMKKPLMRGVFTSDAYMVTGSMLRQGIDLFHWIREAPGVQDIYSEGWKNVSATYETTAWELSVMRAATRYKDRPRVGLLNILQRSPVDIELSVYVGLAHGVNHLWHFGWGPWYTSGDGASHRPEIAPAVRKASFAIGQLEGLLMSDRVRPAEVAILYSFATDAWNWAEHDQNPMWLSENVGVFLSLTHEQIPVDLLVDEDILRGELGRYKVLYVVGPNIARDVVTPIVQWVDKGGVLVGTAGAAMRDEYNRAFNGLDDVFGVRQGELQVGRKVDYMMNLWVHPYLKERVRTPQGVFPVSGACVAMAPAGAKVLYTLEDGSTPAMTEHVHGSGRAYLMSGTLGFTYLHDAVERKARRVKEKSPLYQQSYSPAEYSRVIGQVINLPAVQAGVGRPVEMDAPGVHAGVRHGQDGAVVVLVNYPRVDRQDMDIRVNGLAARRVSKVLSTSLGRELGFEVLDDQRIRIHLPELKLTEMIGIHYE